MTKILVDSELLEEMLDLAYKVSHQNSDVGIEAECLGPSIRAALDAPQQEAVAVATVRFKKTGGNAGVAWYADPIHGVLPKDGETLYVGAMHNEPHPAPSVPEQEARKQLGELLAVIHGDGGHYAAEHGITKATADAIAKWAALRAAPSVPEGWHTTDEQPEDGERLLCFEDYSKFGKLYKGIDCYYYRKGIGFVALPDDTDPYGGITHWTRPTLPSSAAPKAPKATDTNILIAEAYERFAHSYCWDAVEGPQFYREELLKKAAELRAAPKAPSADDRKDAEQR